MNVNLNTGLSYWSHTHLLEPYEEGWARLERAISGKDWYKVDYPELSLQDRAISLISGLSLILPFINSIVWLAMEIFGKAEKLSDPFDPNPIKKLSPEPEPTPLAPIPEGQRPLKVEELKYHYQQLTSGREIDSDWAFKTYADRVEATKTDSLGLVTFTYDLDGKMIRYELDRKEPNIHVTAVKSGDKISLDVSLNGAEPTHSELTVDPKQPWIQYAATGFEEFVLSSKSELPFYGIDHHSRTWQMLATKKGIVTLPGYGDSLLVTANITSFLGRLLGSALGYSFEGKMWFDPETGRLLRAEYPEPTSINSAWPSFAPIVLTRV